MKKNKKYMATAGIITCLLIVAIIIVNVLVGAASSKVNLKIDMTKDGILSFSDTTKDTLAKLDSEINVYSLIPDDESSSIVNQFREIIEKYSKMSSKINYQIIDTEKNPEFVQKYANAGENISIYSVIFESDKRHKVVDLNDAISMNSTTGSIEYISAEKFFTSAIMYVISDQTTKIGVVEGHGEMASASYFESLLKDEGYVVESVNLVTGNIPENVNMLIISTPEKDYASDEIDKINAFLDKGNSIQVLMSPTIAKLDNLYAYLSKWGVEFKPGYIAEKNKNNYYQSQLFVIPEMVESDVTADLISGKMMILYPACRGIKDNTNTNITEHVLLTTGDDAIVKSDVNEVVTDGAISAGDNDFVEKSNLAVILEKKIDDEKSAKMFVSGSIQFIQQSLISSNFANNDFYMNTIAYLTDNQTNIYIRAKDVSTPYITISAMWGLIFGAITVIIIPLVFLVIGLVIWMRRRHL